MIQVWQILLCKSMEQKICEINYYSAIINTFDPAYDKLKRKKDDKMFYGINGELL